MADAIASRAFQDHGIFYFSLFCRGFEHDVLDAITDLHCLPAKISLRRRKQKILVFTFLVECQFDLCEWLHANQLSRFQIEWLVPIAGAVG